MKGTRKLICVLMTLCLLLSLGGFALAGSGEPSGETLSRYEELTEVKSYPNGLTIADNAGYTGAEYIFCDGRVPCAVAVIQKQGREAK